MEGVIMTNAKVNASEYPEFRKRITAWYDGLVGQCDDVWNDSSLSVDEKSNRFASILDAHGMV
jgi:hypothetical protein